jgi:hypothetical protein
MKVNKSARLLGVMAVAVLGFVGNAYAVDVDDFHPVIQHICNPPPVPEADTWAMMAVGLGLVGLRLRRKGKKSQEAIN